MEDNYFFKQPTWKSILNTLFGKVCQLLEKLDEAEKSHLKYWKSKGPDFYLQGIFT